MKIKLQSSYANTLSLPNFSVSSKSSARLRKAFKYTGSNSTALLQFFIAYYQSYDYNLLKGWTDLTFLLENLIEHPIKYFLLLKITSYNLKVSPLFKRVEKLQRVRGYTISIIAYV